MVDGILNLLWGGNLELHFLEFFMILISSLCLCRIYMIRLSK
jgi:hypothetical protein